MFVAGINLKATDEDLREVVLSWQQEEKNLALTISRELGTLASTGPLKFRGKLDERLKADCKILVSSPRAVCPALSRRLLTN